MAERQQFFCCWFGCSQGGSRDEISPCALGLRRRLGAGGPASAVELAIVSGAVGNDLQILRDQLDKYEQKSGNKVSIVSMPPSTTDQFAQYRLWLAAQNADIDVYQTDVIWAPQLANQLRRPDRGDRGRGQGPLPGDHRVADGRRQARRAADVHRRAGALLPQGSAGQVRRQGADDLEGDGRYRQEDQDKERAAGNKDIWGFVFQGKAYEGLTCDALEWVKSNGGGQIVEADGKISINNPKAAKAIDMVKGWVGTISPPGVLAYQEEEARGVWQSGNAVFMRNWPYAYGARQQRRPADQGQVRRGRAADRAPRASARRRRSAAGTSRCRSIRRTPRRRSIWSSTSPRPRSRSTAP